MGCFSSTQARTSAHTEKAAWWSPASSSTTARYGHFAAGQRNRGYYHARHAFNYRMDGIRGAILRVKLQHLPTWTEA